MVIILLNIRSMHNVGSIFRTADAAGIKKLYLCGITPAPIDRFGKKRTDLAKVSLGAEDSVEWEKIGSTIDIKPAVALIQALKKDGYTILALEQDARSKNLFEYIPNKPEKTALIVGNEVDGIDAFVLSLADTILEIPLYGKKESLNVSVAFGIAAYHLLRPKQ